MRLMSERGDTIVEVLLASVALSIVLLGAYLLANESTKTNNDAYERTRAIYLLRQQGEFLLATPYADWSAYSGGDTSFSCSGVDLSTLSDSDKFHFADDGSVVSGIAEIGIFSVWIAGNPQSNYTESTVYACWDQLGGGVVNQSSLPVRVQL